MKESVLSVLVYLFRNYFLGEPDTVHDRDSLQSELIDAGFDALHVGKAFDWLAELQDDTHTAANVARSQPVRVYAAEELDLLDAECRGFLMALEQRGVLDAEARERVIERALALEQSPVDLHDLKWVVLLVLYNTPDREAGYAWMESELLGAHMRRN
ncbi:MAG: DUF494 domain-containing protein [Rhodanobacteraceae bacterium]|nr:DUF494 domain-containing protein [Rhodanobacteraceae bacterium]MBL0039804.1 DUF494 domain-containing protein [Xanthomonadales bacterium]